jgi:predicted transcriptional regulator
VTEVVAAQLSNHKTPSSHVVPLIQSVHQVLSELSLNGAAEELPEPAIAIKRSVAPDYIGSLEDGRKLKGLKRYLRTSYDMTADQYRRRWGLPALSDDRTELCEKAKPVCEESRAWYATASEARKGVSPGSPGCYLN